MEICVVIVAMLSGFFGANNSQEKVHVDEIMVDCKKILLFLAALVLWLVKMMTDWQHVDETCWRRTRGSCVEMAKFPEPFAYPIQNVHH
jgi:hypothetical protein